jgi:uncharacterized membrane protein HdeD (DUF308 family)
MLTLTYATVAQHRNSTEGATMIVLGLILLIIGLIASISILTILGLVLIIAGLVVNLVPIGGTRRRVY